MVVSPSTDGVSCVGGCGGDTVGEEAGPVEVGGVGNMMLIVQPMSVSRVSTATIRSKTWLFTFTSVSGCMAIDRLINARGRLNSGDSGTVDARDKKVGAGLDCVLGRGQISLTPYGTS